MRNRRCAPSRAHRQGEGGTVPHYGHLCVLGTGVLDTELLGAWGAKENSDSSATPFPLPLGRRPPWGQLLLCSLSCMQLSSGGLCCWTPLGTQASTRELTGPQRENTSAHTGFISLRTIFWPLPVLSLCVISQLVQNSGKEKGCFLVVPLSPSTRMRGWEREWATPLHLWVSRAWADHLPDHL